MTREEAIHFAECLKNNWTINFADMEEFCDMAIEALSAEGAVLKEYEAEFTDLPDIPRYYYEKVVGKMAHEINMLKQQLESANAEQGVGRYENAMQKLREMPRYLNGVKEKQITKISAEAAQGEWKIDEYGIYHCPFCHAINNTVYKSFCPNCGARMEANE